MKTKKLIICALFTAIIAMCAPFFIMIGPVPITFTLFALALAAFVAGSKAAFVATLVYIFIGIVGLPVFSGFKGGLGGIITPTGGFVFSYVFVVLILGMCNKTKKKSIMALWWTIALCVCYACGTLWYMVFTSSDFVTALMLCVVPFIPFDVVKLVMAYCVAKAIKKRGIAVGRLK